MSGVISSQAAAAQALRIAHFISVVGTSWYVDGDSGVDTNSGVTPEDAFLTIGAAITACAAGDAIVVAPATYTEINLDLNKANVQMFFAIGAVIDPASNTALTISGAYCKLTGYLTVMPAAGVTGVALSGANCVLENVKVLAGAVGYLITGSGAVLNDCAAGLQTTTAYDIQATQGRLFRCKTVGVGATIGYKINGLVDTGVLDHCTSVGHTTSGFSIATGSQDWTILDCSSGAGDGKFVDVDHANVWSNYTFETVVAKTVTFAGAPTTYNLFEIVGVVRIKNIYGVVETQIAGTNAMIYLQAYSTNGTDDITDAPGTQLNGLVVDSLLVRNEDSTNALDLAEPDTGPAIAESTNFRDPKTEIDIAADREDTTYLRAVLSAALASGTIHWHCEYEPLSDNGFVSAV